MPNTLKRWIIWLLIISFLWLVISRMTEISYLADTLSKGQWQWVWVAIFLQVIYYLTLAELYRSGFDTVGVKARIRDLVPVTFASLFVNVAVPTAGASGAALFVDDATHRGQSATRAAAGTLLVLVVSYTSVLLVLIAGMAYLFIQDSLRLYEIIGASILLVGTLGQVTLLLLGLWRPEWMHRMLISIQRLVNNLAAHFHRPDILEASWAEITAGEFSEAARAIVAHPSRLARTLAIALFAHALNLACLFTLFLSFHQTVNLGVLVAGYAMGMLFLIVSITPQGIGVVEGVMTLVFTSLHVPAAQSAVVSLAFRGLTFWLPLLIGFILLRRVKTFRAVVSNQDGEQDYRTAAEFTALIGLLNLLSALVPNLPEPVRVIEQYAPLGVNSAGRLIAGLAGIALILLAGGLWRRVRIAYWLTMVFLAISIVNIIIKRQDLMVAVVSIVMAAWLTYLRPRFESPPDLARSP
jgi:glycosyltransferase 2 family protein